MASIIRYRPVSHRAEGNPHGRIEQDKVVLEAVQKRFDEEGWDLPEISVRADAAALNFRKKMAALVEEERRRLAPKALQSA